jgi:hypothetical protein
MIIFILAFTVFQVEQYAQSLRGELIETNRQLKTNLDELHVLKAEWVYLTSPKRLEEMSGKYLRTSHASISQIKSLDLIPMKPVILAKKVR